MFGRRRKRDEKSKNVSDDIETGENTAEDTDAEDSAESEDSSKEEVTRAKLPPGPRPDGPWDLSEVSEPSKGRVDLGGLFVPAVEGMELRVELARDSGVDAIVGATVVLKDSAIQLQAFAAPKREGIWDEIREEIASGITQKGGVIDETEGPLGWEVRAQVPVQLPDGNNGVQVVRFVGVDGPRWFLRGVISGQGAVQPESAGLLEQVFQDTVVVRGDSPMAPRDPIVLKLPDDAQMVADTVKQEEPTEEASRFAGGLDKLQRGPEVTEVR